MSHRRVQVAYTKAAVPTFELFPSLPIELRQCIWGLTTEPRRVPVGGFPSTIYDRAPPPPSTPPPAVFQVNNEARSYLKRYYTKAFATESPPRHTWVNFEIDTVFIRQWNIPKFSTDLRCVKHLSIEIDDIEWFYRKFMIVRRDYPVLETLELQPYRGPRTVGPSSSLDWTRDWDQYMGICYSRDDPVTFRTTVVGPHPDHPLHELNPDNYLKARRDLLRQMIRENPDDYGPEFDPWDSDDYPDRCEIGWRHAPGCSCTSAERWPPRHR